MEHREITILFDSNSASYFLKCPLNTNNGTITTIYIQNYEGKFTCTYKLISISLRFQ